MATKKMMDAAIKAAKKNYRPLTLGVAKRPDGRIHVDLDVTQLGAGTVLSSFLGFLNEVFTDQKAVYEDKSKTTQERAAAYVSAKNAKDLIEGLKELLPEGGKFTAEELGFYKPSAWEAFWATIAALQAEDPIGGKKEEEDLEEFEADPEL